MKIPILIAIPVFVLVFYGTVFAGPFNRGNNRMKKVFDSREPAKEIAENANATDSKPPASAQEQVTSGYRPPRPDAHNDPDAASGWSEPVEVPMFRSAEELEQYVASKNGDLEDPAAVGGGARNPARVSQHHDGVELGPGAAGDSLPGEATPETPFTPIPIAGDLPNDLSPVVNSPEVPDSNPDSDLEVTGPDDDSRGLAGELNEDRPNPGGDEGDLNASTPDSKENGKASMLDEIFMIADFLRDGDYSAIRKTRYDNSESTYLARHIAEALGTDEIDSLKRQIAEKEAELKALSSGENDEDISFLQAKIASKDDEIDSLRQELLAADENTSSSETARLQDEISRLRDTLNHHEEVRAVSVGELNSALLDFDLPMLNTENAIPVIAERMSEFQELRNRIKEARMRQMEAEAEVRVWKEKAEAKDTRTESLLADIASLETKISEKEEVESMLKESLEKAEGRLESARIKLEALRSKSEFEINRKDERIEEYRENIVKHLQQISDLTATISKMAERPDSGLMIRSDDEEGAVSLAYDIPKLRLMIKNVLQTIHNYSHQSPPEYDSIEYVVSEGFLERVREAFNQSLPQLQKHSVTQSFELNEVNFQSHEDFIEAECKGIYNVVSRGSKVSLFEYSAVVKLIPTEHNSFNPTGFIITSIKEESPNRLKTSDLQ